jgi:hypothetical protein
VRCARCSHDWRAEMPQEPASALAAQLAALAPVSGAIKPLRPGANVPALRKEAGLSGRRAALFAVIFLAVAIGFLAWDRGDIVRTYPWMAGIYDHVGLRPYRPGEGLSLRQVHSELEFNGGLTQLVVEGQIHNNTGRIVAIPNLLAVAMGSDGKPMQSWQIDAPAAKVPPGAAVPFKSTIRAPEGTVAEINLSFVDKDHAQ